MIEERGQVMAVERGQVRVAVSRQSSCGSCKARAACGQGLMQGLKPGRIHEVLALCELPVQAGDVVVLGVDESLALRGAFLVYLLPLLALLAGALLVERAGLGEGWAIIGGLVGFSAAVAGLYLYNRSLAGRDGMLPRVLRVEPATEQVTAVRWLP